MLKIKELTFSFACLSSRSFFSAAASSSNFCGIPDSDPAALTIKLHSSCESHLCISHISTPPAYEHGFLLGQNFGFCWLKHPSYWLTQKYWSSADLKMSSQYCNSVLALHLHISDSQRFWDLINICHTPSETSCFTFSLTTQEFSYLFGYKYHLNCPPSLWCFDKWRAILVWSVALLI